MSIKDEQREQMCIYMYTTDYSALKEGNSKTYVMDKKSEYIMQSEISNTQKRKYCMILFT